MDDETYVKMKFHQLPGTVFYMSRIQGKLPNKYTRVLVDKFGKKIMIWRTICSRGRKTPAFVIKSTMRSDLYTTTALQKYGLPFIKSLRRSVIFWPNLASWNYSKNTILWDNQNKVRILPKEMNPANCPEINQRFLIEKNFERLSNGYWRRLKNFHRRPIALKNMEQSSSLSWRRDCAKSHGIHQKEGPKFYQKLRFYSLNCYFLETVVMYQI